jgi:hypothetical protein
LLIDALGILIRFLYLAEGIILFALLPQLIYRLVLEVKVAEMEGKENGRPVYTLIRYLINFFKKDLKADPDPTINLQAAINEVEQGKIDLELFKINLRLTKDPKKYIGM